MEDKMKKINNFILLLLLFFITLICIANCSEAGSSGKKSDDEDKRKSLKNDVITKYDFNNDISWIATVEYDRYGKILTHEFIDKKASINNCSTKYSYNSNGRKNSIIWNYYNKKSVITDSFTYETIDDKFTITKTSTDSNNQIIETRIEEYVNGKLSRETNIDNESDDEDISITDYFYDVEGKIIKKEHMHEDKDSGIVKESYDFFDYDSNGRNVKITSYDSNSNEIEKIITIDYDSKNRKILEKMEYLPIPDDNYYKYYYYNKNSLINKIIANFSEKESNYTEVHIYGYY